MSVDIQVSAILGMVISLPPGLRIGPQLEIIVTSPSTHPANSLSHPVSVVLRSLRVSCFPEWLSNRRLVPPDWPARLADLQNKISQAAKHIPPGAGPIPPLEDPVHLGSSFMFCQRAVADLEQFEAASGRPLKDFFGYFNQPCLRALDAHLRTFRKKKVRVPVSPKAP